MGVSIFLIESVIINSLIENPMDEIIKVSYGSTYIMNRPSLLEMLPQSFRLLIICASGTGNRLSAVTSLASSIKSESFSGFCADTLFNKSENNNKNTGKTNLLICLSPYVLENSNRYKFFIKTDICILAIFYGIKLQICSIPKS